MKIGVYDSLLPFGSELFRVIASEVSYFKNDDLIPISQLISTKNIQIDHRNFLVTNISQLNDGDLDVLLILHDDNFSEQINILKRKSKYIIEIRALASLGKPFIFDVSDNNNSNLAKEKHFSIPHSFSIAISNIAKNISELAKIKSIFACGYNSVSNGKYQELNDLYNETKGFFEASILDKQEEKKEKERKAFNCIPRVGELKDNQTATTFENKIEKECLSCFKENKILTTDNFNIMVNLSQVPVFRGDSYFVKMELDGVVPSLDVIQDTLENSERLFPTENIITQAEVAQNNNIFMSRLRCEVGYISFYMALDNIKIEIANAVELAQQLKNQ